MFNEQQLQEISDTQRDARFALKTLIEIQQIPEEEIANTDVSVNALSLRNSFELLVGMLENMGMDVAQEERFENMLRNLTNSGNVEVSVSVH